jgi:hypothetical protein
MALWLLIEVALASGRLPRQLFVSEVDISSDRERVLYSSYEEIIMGTWRKYKIAIKKQRVFKEDNFWYKVGVRAAPAFTD